MTRSGVNAVMFGRQETRMCNRVTSCSVIFLWDQDNCSIDMIVEAG